MAWWLIVVYMIGWAIHRAKKATGWIGQKRRAGTQATLADWWSVYGFSAVSDAFGQVIFAFGWAAGFFRTLLTKVVPAEYLTIPAETGVLIEVALALFAGYMGSSLIHEIVVRTKAKREAIP